MMYVSTISAASISSPPSQRRSSSAVQRVIRSSVSIRRRFVRRTASSSSIRTGGVSHPPCSKAGLIGVLRREYRLHIPRRRQRRRSPHRSAAREEGACLQHIQHVRTAGGRGLSATRCSVFWRDCIFDFCGVKDFDRVMFRIVADSSADERSAWLEEAADRARRAFPSP